MALRLIGFNGSMGCGKSTAIAMLEAAMREVGDSRKLTLIKFAGKLYEFQEYLYGQIESVYQRPSDFVKDRKLLQWLGTDWGRGLDENLWVKLWLSQVNSALERGELVVCDDIRFDNEGALFKEIGGTVIKIERHDAKMHAQGGVGIAGHVSEAGIDPKYIDFYVQNNSSLEAYKNSLTDLYRSLEVSSGNTK